MNLLAIDTSTDRGIVGLLTSEGGRLAASTEASRRHGRDLVPILHNLLGRGGIRAPDLEVIAIGLGPGSYTGLRIGLTAARTLAYATGALVFGFDSLEAISRNAPAEALRVSVVADAQRGDLYVADFERTPTQANLVRVSASRIERLGEWAARLTPGAIVLGPALQVASIRACLPAGLLEVEDALHRPRGESIIALAEEMVAFGTPDDLWGLEPHYLRRSAAEDQWETRASPVSH